MKDSKTQIRLIQKNDASEFFTLIKDNRNFLRTWLTWLDRMTSITAAEHYIESRVKLASEKRGFCFGIHSEGRLIGIAHLVDIDAESRSAMIGYWVGESFSGQGHATQATRAILDYAFGELKLHRIEIRCAVGNLRSSGVPKKIGFRHEGVLRDGEWLHDQFVDQNLYSILSTEWTNYAEIG